MDIVASTRMYEKWLGRRLTLIPRDLRLKHELMKSGPFPFLRATFYRWCQLWFELCPESAIASRILAVGDLHVENFGTWRDSEGRLIWGINDFDETAVMPFTLDLVRLAVSAHLATEAGAMRITLREANDAILQGYLDGLQSGGCPFVLGEQHHWLRELAVSELRDPAAFWKKMGEIPVWRGKIPRSARKAIERLMPECGLEYTIVHRTAGLGSLGRERFAAIVDWCGGKIAREAKSLTLSAYRWAENPSIKANAIFYEKVLKRSVRCEDPYLRLRDRWIVRRLAPDCSRIELSSLSQQRDESRLLANMGRETANIHLGSRGAAKSILRELRKMPAGWLHDASKALYKATVNDWNAWRKAR